MKRRILVALLVMTSATACQSDAPEACALPGIREITVTIIGPPLRTPNLVVNQRTIRRTIYILPFHADTVRFDEQPTPQAVWDRIEQAACRKRKEKSEKSTGNTFITVRTAATGAFKYDAASDDPLLVEVKAVFQEQFGTTIHDLQPGHGNVEALTGS